MKLTNLCKDLQTNEANRENLQSEWKRIGWICQIESCELNRPLQQIDLRFAVQIVQIICIHEYISIIRPIRTICTRHAVRIGKIRRANRAYHELNWPHESPDFPIIITPNEIYFLNVGPV